MSTKRPRHAGTHKFRHALWMNTERHIGRVSSLVMSPRRAVRRTQPSIAIGVPALHELGPILLPELAEQRSLGESATADRVAADPLTRLLEALRPPSQDGELLVDHRAEDVVVEDPVMVT